MPQGASVPALGLSNKAVYDEEKKIAESVPSDKKSSLADDLYKEVYFNIIDLNSNLYLKFFCNLKRRTLIYLRSIS
jgi:hypothetical protein